MKSNLVLAFVLTLIVSNFALAGIYSDATDIDNAYDAAIPGFVNSEVNPVFVGWASSYSNYYRSDSGTSYSDPNLALGVVVGTSFDVVSLGDLTQEEINAGTNVGEITLGFDVTICNGDGADFAVFENGSVYSGKLNAELAYVEVSTDGVNFVRFPNISLTESTVGGYGTIDATDVYNLAGKHAKSYGTPFNLDDLANEAFVLDGTVDLNNVNYIKLVDIPGSGSYVDSEGNSIYDAWHTWGSGGFDLDAVGVINAVPEPSMAFLLVGFATMGMLARRKFQ